MGCTKARIAAALHQARHASSWLAPALRDAASLTAFARSAKANADVSASAAGPVASPSPADASLLPAAGRVLCLAMLAWSSAQAASAVLRARRRVSDSAPPAVITASGTSARPSTHPRRTVGQADGAPHATATGLDRMPGRSWAAKPAEAPSPRRQASVIQRVGTVSPVPGTQWRALVAGPMTVTPDAPPGSSHNTANDHRNGSRHPPSEMTDDDGSAGSYHAAETALAPAGRLGDAITVADWLPSPLPSALEAAPAAEVASHLWIQTTTEAGTGPSATEATSPGLGDQLANTCFSPADIARMRRPRKHGPLRPRVQGGPQGEW